MKILAKCGIITCKQNLRIPKLKQRSVKQFNNHKALQACKQLKTSLAYKHKLRDLNV